MEGFINLYENEDKSGNRPHYKAIFKIGDEWHEAALWPAREGKKGFSGKYKVQEKRKNIIPDPVQTVAAPHDDIQY